jgi:hypothetical protein
MKGYLSNLEIYPTSDLIEKPEESENGFNVDEKPGL